jgi:hypothetical protein
MQLGERAASYHQPMVCSRDIAYKDTRFRAAEDAVQ